MSFLKIAVLMSIVTSYVKVGGELVFAVLWGLLSLFFHSWSDGWIYPVIFSFASFLIAYGVFTLATYFGDSVFARLMVLVFGAVIMLIM